MIRHFILDAFVLAGVLIALATLPGTLELLFLTLGGVLPRRKFEHGPHKSVAHRTAFVVPAHDEESVIEACIKSLLACDQSDGVAPIFVVADNCTDRTNEFALRAGATVLVRTDSTRRGKGYALDFAFETLAGLEFNRFIVVDADSSVTPDLLRAVNEKFDAGADAIQCRYKVRNASESTRTRWMNIALMAFNVLRPRGRDRLGLSAGILGNGFALSRETLEQVPYHAVSVVEDLEYHIRLVEAGLKVRFVDTATVYGEMPTGGKGVSTQRARWEGGRFRMAAKFVPQLLGDVLTGKLRLLEPLGDLLLLPLAFHVALVLLVLMTPLWPVRLYAACALGVVAVHVLATIVVCGGNWRDLGALFSAVFYLLWKVRTIPALLRNASGNAAWVRTERARLNGVPK